MNAYKVSYDVGGSSGNSAVVFAINEAYIPEELEKKDNDFEVDSRWCKIVRVKQVPLSTVKLTDLSVQDLLKILGK
jgi:hypothetical protein